MNNKKLSTKKNNTTARGFFTLFVLIATAVFLMFLTDLVDSIFIQKNAEHLGIDQERARDIAEAGLEYYRWHFAQFPGDVQNSTGAAGPYQGTVQEPETGATFGTFSLAINGVTNCGVLTSASVASTGWATSTPSHTKTLIAMYGKPTLASATSPASPNQTTLAVDLTNLKTYAQASGVYLAPSGAGKYGYKIVMNGNGTLDVSPVTAVTQVWGFSTPGGWQQENTVIASTGATTNYSVPPSCPVIFVEDNVWLEGVVSGKVTLASADLVDSGVDTDMVLTGNITYQHAYGDGLTAIAERSLLISLQSPDVMQMKGIYVADKGHFGRNRYDSSGAHAVPSALQSYTTRTSLSTYGTFASTGTTNTKWTSDGTFISGYSTETDTHDGLLAENPPPFTPETGSTFQFLDLREKN